MLATDYRDLSFNNKPLLGIRVVSQGRKWRTDKRGCTALVTVVVLSAAACWDCAQRNFRL